MNPPASSSSLAHSSVQHRLLGLVAGFVALLVCAVYLAWFNVQSERERDSIRERVQHTLNALSAVQQTQNALLTLRRGLIMVASNVPGADFRPEVEQQRLSALPPLRAATQQLLAYDPAAAAAVQQAGDHLVSNAVRGAELIHAGDVDSGTPLLRAFVPISAPAEAMLRGSFDSAQQSLKLALAESERAEQGGQHMAWAALGVLLAFGVAALLFVLRGVFRPLRALNAAIQRIGRGEELREAPLAGKDEFGALGRALFDHSRHVGHLNQLAYFDTLTELPNRTRLLNDLERHLAGRRGFALVFADIDQFRTINEGYGHRFGDLVIQSLGQRLRWILKEGTCLYRHSGDLFALLIPLTAEMDRAGVERECERLRLASSELTVIEGHRLALSLSFGVATSPADGSTVEALLSASDAAMYEAKALGRNCVQFARGDHALKARQRLELADDLRVAIASGQVEPYFQPIIDLVAGELKCAEALARWKHPIRGFVSPDEFIGVAEASGQIDALTRVLLRAACTAAVRWQADRETPPRLAFNLSARQVRPGVVEMVQGVLADTGLPASRLEIEITESAIIERPETAERLLRELRAIGVSVALDDFGTGYSSLSYLLRFPIDKIKVDRSFVAQLEGQRQAGKIVAATISLATSLDIVLVAEGVEKIGQMVTLVELGCRQQQGWLFSKALPAAEFERWMAVAPLRIDGVLRSQADAANDVRAAA